MAKRTYAATIILVLIASSAFGASEIAPSSNTSTAEEPFAKSPARDLAGKSTYFGSSKGSNSSDGSGNSGGSGNGKSSGGADPSGGEGQRSSPEQLRLTVNSSLKQLSWLFFRMSYFFKSADEADQKVVRDIDFLKNCFASDQTDCRAGVFKTIEQVVKKFERSQNFVPGDCPSKDKEHKQTDMSITPDLDLCVSEQLTRYPLRELQRQVLSLLAHEIVHGLGFDENSSRSVQYWVVENKGISFPSESFAKHYNKRSQAYSFRLRLLARLLGIREPADPMRICEYVIQANTDFKNLESLYVGEEDETFVTVPAYPIKKLSEATQGRSEDLIVEYCIKKTPVGDSQAIFKKLLELTERFDALQTTLTIYMTKLIEPSALEYGPNPKSLLTTLIGSHDKKNPSSVGKKVSCVIQGNETSRVELGIGNNHEKEQELPLSQVFPQEMQSEIPKLTAFVSRLNPSGGTGIAIQFDSSKTLRPLIVSTNAEAKRGAFLKATPIALFKVLGTDHVFRSVFQMVRKGSSEKVGPEFELLCMDGE